MFSMKTILKVAVGLLAGSAPMAGAQFDLGWFTLDNGGGTIAGGGWVLDGTIGQPDAGPVLSGGPFRLTGGFLVFGVQKGKLGDLNCDGQVNFADINPFALALSDAELYQQRYPNCNIFNADCNQDGRINFADINPFVALLSADGV